MMTRQHFKTIGVVLFKIVVTVLFLSWAYSRIEDPAELARNFRESLDFPGWLAVGISLGGVVVLMTALRFYILLKAQSIKISLLEMVRFTLVATLLDLASFGSAAGDAYKMICLMRRNPDRKMVITMVTVVDHMMGFISGGSIFLFCTWALGIAQNATNPGVEKTLLGVTVFQGCGLVGLGICWLMSSTKLIKLTRQKLPKMMANSFVDTISSSLNLFHTHWRSIIGSLGASFVLSVSYFLTFYVALKTISVSVGISTILASMPVVDVISSLPITISGLGVRERTFEFLIGDLAGISPGEAVSASLIGFTFNIFWGFVGGILFVVQRSQKGAQLHSE